MHSKEYSGDITSFRFSSIHALAGSRETVQHYFSCNRTVEAPANAAIHQHMRRGELTEVFEAQHKAIQIIEMTRWKDRIPFQQDFKRI
ncbi:hypothetical protein Nepgr_003974 [Nepenthes gracilis]|uniref:Uncharacterized protein n=1 Tax=Nepenthes gracilis TaxID=150966 RepID=A0AAD3S0I8_NEPGR|nr:hypothetical protein Nepgr_003974 [Nepenthes gracilis]